MAKGKKSKGKHYESKGLYRNISRWAKLANRKDKKENPSVTSMFQREERVKQIISSPKNETERKVRERLLAKQKIESRCAELLKTYEVAGLTRAEAIHAIKTDYVSTLCNKWDSKLSTWSAANKDKPKATSGVRIVSG